jgi:3-hydroxybutyrate dehydrogenase
MGLLEGKRALVWGGGSGIGYGCAEAFLAQGARVAIASRDSKRLTDAAARLGGCAWATGDATD